MSREPAYIWHVTLTSGHGRRSPRSEVSEQAVSTVGDIVRRAVAGDGDLIPLPLVGIGYWITAEALGKCLISTIFGDTPQGPTPIITMGTGGHSKCAARLWRSMTAGIPGLALGVDDLPAAPWQADRLEIGATVFPEAAEWTGDLSRLIAWAWIER